MIQYLETTLGNMAKNIWDNFKSTHEVEYQKLINLGNNPYNFCNFVGNILTATDPNMRSIYQQTEAVRKL